MYFSRVLCVAYYVHKNVRNAEHRAKRLAVVRRRFYDGYREGSILEATVLLGRLIHANRIIIIIVIITVSSGSCCC